MLAQRLTHLRKLKNVNQAEIADIIQVARTTYSGYEKDRIPSLDILIKLADYHGLTLDSLVCHHCPDAIDTEVELTKFTDTVLSLDIKQRAEFTQHINQYSKMIVDTFYTNTKKSDIQ